MKIEFTDRYKATGTPYPDPETMCEGQCEGMGTVPILENDMDEPWRSLWLEAEKKSPSKDGWHFVECPECKGTGLKSTGAVELVEKCKMCEDMQRIIEELRMAVGLASTIGDTNVVANPGNPVTWMQDVAREVSEKIKSLAGGQEGGSDA